MLLRTGSVVPLLLCVLSIALVECRDFHTWNSNMETVIRAYNTKDFTERIKRGVSFAVRGMAALRKLLVGADKLNIQSQTHRLYVKDGNFETARMDFLSVKPTNVRERKKNQVFSVHYPVGRVISGNVGNRRLLLKEVGDDGQPVLEVIETKLDPGPYIDQITYRPKKKN